MKQKLILNCQQLLSVSMSLNPTVCATVRHVMTESPLWFKAVSKLFFNKKALSLFCLSNIIFFQSNTFIGVVSLHNYMNMIVM